jgi:hypothetical protein
MKEYIVSFYYYTDLRTDKMIKARSALAALVLAESELPEWCENGKGFYIKVERVW